MRLPQRQRIVAGFCPTTDSAVLVVAREKGFAADEGIELELARKGSVNDLLAALAGGDLAFAALPAAIPVASALGIETVPENLIAPFVLALGGSVFAVSADLYAEMWAEGLRDLEPSRVASTLTRLCSRRQSRRAPALKFAVEHRYSSGWYELRYLLASSGIAVPQAAEIVVAAAQDMPGLLEAGEIDGFYAPEPYGSAAVLRGTAHIVTVKSKIWRNAPEKLLVMSPLAGIGPQHLDALLRALYRAGEWCANHNNIEELAGILAAPHHLGIDGDLLLPALTGILPLSRTSTSEISTATPDEFLVMSGKAANFPWQSQALWFLSQMSRWGDCPSRAQDEETVREKVRDAYRPDLYRRALKPIFAPVPGANLKMEGTLLKEVHVGASRSGLVLGPDGFFDGRIFDPERF
jgi:NitT/TauT family transport system ATP-binding protein